MDNHAARHRRNQVVVSIGTLAASAVSLYYPSAVEAAVLVNLSVNLVWIWEL